MKAMKYFRDRENFVEFHTFSNMNILSRNTFLHRTLEYSLKLV